MLDAQSGAAKHAIVYASSPRNRLPLGAEVQAQATTDEQGAFTLTMPDAWVRASGYKRLTLWAWTPDLGATGVVYQPEDVPAGQPVILRLGPPVESVLEVVDADGKPVAGARVEPRMIDLVMLKENVPPELSARLVTTTDEKGRVTLRSWTREKTASWFVESVRCGKQELRDFSDRPPHWAEGRLMLQPVARVDIVAGEQAHLRAGGKPLQLTTFRSSPLGNQIDPLRNSNSTATVVLGVDGHAHVDAIAAGGMMLVFDAASLDEQRPTVPRLDIQPGTKNEIKIDWRPAVHVTGRLVSHGLGTPVPGARISWNQYPLVDCEALTDADGRFTTLLSAGPAYIDDIDVDRPHVDLHWADKFTFEIPADVRDHDIGDVRLPGGISVRGTVVNAERSPVAGAWVIAKWPEQFSYGFATAVADDLGAFELWPVPEDESIELLARFGEQTMTDPVLATARVDVPIEVMIGVQLRVTMKGLVVGEDGRPIADARVEVWELGGRNPDSQIGPDLRTDAAGRFETPRELRADVKYCVRVVAPGHEPWSSPQALPGAELRLTPRKLARVEGIVRGTDGEPLENALVSTRDALNQVEAFTDENGRFVLEGVMPGTSVLVVRAGDLPLQGRFVDAGAKPLEWQLDMGSDERSRLRTLDPLLERPRELSIALDAARACVDAALEHKQPVDAYRALAVAARIDPGYALARLEEGVIEARYADYVRTEAVDSLTDRFPADALLISRLEQKPTLRSRDLQRIAESLPPAESARKLELLAEAVAEARQVDDPASRLMTLGSMARALLHAGESAQARVVLDEGLAIADKLPNEKWAGSARAVFAETLVLVDQERALDIIGQMKDASDRDRHYGNVAKRLSRSDPEAAERIILLAKKDPYSYIQQAIPGVCYGMAPVDLPRARRIAELHAADVRGHAYGMMALALSRTQPEASVQLLDEAFRVLRAFSAPTSAPSWSVCDYPVMAAALLPIVEEVAPKRLPEFLWQALSMRQTRAPGANFDVWDGHLQSDIGLALLVARYDREMARKLLEPALAAFRDPDRTRFRQRCDSLLLAALTVTDPEWAAQVAGEFSDRARAAIPSVLARTDDERWSFVVSNYIGLWIPGKGDL